MSLKIKLAARGKSRKVDALAVFVYQNQKRLGAEYASIDEGTGNALSQALKRPECTAAAGSVYVAHCDQGPARLFICGLGSAEQFTSNTLRLAGARLVRALREAEVDRVRLSVAHEASHAVIGADRLAIDQVGRALAEGMTIGSFDFDAYKGAGRKSNDTKLRELTVELEADLRDGFNTGLMIAQAQQSARELAATPPNVANPHYLVNYCRKLARQTGLKCTVIDAKKAAELGMGGLEAVGRAGSTPPAIIILEWKPNSASRKKKAPTRSRTLNTGPLMFVGKAITFDTGGYSLKVGGSMVGMKYDKCGGMTVIGAMQAIANLKLNQHVVGIIAAAENMIDENAYRVDDILTMYNGVTVEVGNTDAEGRLVLGDALSYGSKTYDPRAIVDFATLTGGVVVALGSFCAGTWSNDDALFARLEQAAGTSGEKLWRMPIWDEHRAMIRSTHADISNAPGEREAHPIQGAAFLSYFIDAKSPTQMPRLPWAHVDIAGVASVKGESDRTGLYGKGPTGYGVRLAVDLARQW